MARLRSSQRLLRWLLLGGAVLTLILGGAAWLFHAPLDAGDASGAGAQPGRQGGRTGVDSGAHKGPGW